MQKSNAVPGWIPLNWIQKDLAGASQADFVFVFGHKPIILPSAGPSLQSNGRDTIYNCDGNMLARDLFTTLENTDNFVAYLCAHKHYWDATKLQQSIWQVIAGNAGSRLERGDQFGFTLIEIYASGKVVATPFVRPVPRDGYYSPTGVGPATAGTSFPLD